MLTRLDYFIDKLLTKEHKLNKSKTNKSLLNAKDFLKILHYY